MGDAYAYADSTSPEAEPTDELLLLTYIDRFGVEAVMGRPILYAGEMRRMILAGQVYKAYKERQASKSMPEWSRKHPGLANILADASRIAAEGNYLDKDGE